ncbi:hypothetical protein ADUPG1_008528 [Aduncisulcus paluster]|uniref:Uncharacterized protein n=1 Tax=Aduncisulcus paluster TaxID=2918883 RepID=A0ABQ5KUN7_9EUKA|nr:hypothetical protein ADUPG1_008528 [Aduncisulcus paluster]
MKDYFVPFDSLPVSERIFLFKNFCAKKIQHVYRDKKEFELDKKKQEAAKKILKCWRNFSDRRLFLYYRDLIKLAAEGDAAGVLKTINPVEAGLIDQAIDAEVMFRLAGPTFPPTLVYKIIFHNPHTDLCLLAPRDYYGEKKRQLQKDREEEQHLKEYAHSRTATLKKGFKRASIENALIEHGVFPPPPTYKKSTISSSGTGKKSLTYSSTMPRLHEGDEYVVTMLGADGNVSHAAVYSEGASEPLLWYQGDVSNKWREVATGEILGNYLIRNRKRISQKGISATELRTLSHSIYRKTFDPKTSGYEYQGSLSMEGRARAMLKKRRSRQRKWIGAFKKLKIAEQKVDEEGSKLIDWSESLDFMNYVKEWESMASFSIQKSPAKFKEIRMADDLGYTSSNRQEEMLDKIGAELDEEERMDRELKLKKQREIERDIERDKQEQELRGEYVIPLRGVEILKSREHVGRVLGDEKLFE